MNETVLHHLFSFKICTHFLNFLFLRSWNSETTEKLGSYPLSADKHSVNYAPGGSLTCSDHQNLRFFQQRAHKSEQQKERKTHKMTKRLGWRRMLLRPSWFSLTLICPNVIPKYDVLTETFCTPNLLFQFFSFFPLVANGKLGFQRAQLGDGGLHGNQLVNEILQKTQKNLVTIT